jgi:colanic acid biosynthesis glycosyl transferase WcaI
VLSTGSNPWLRKPTSKSVSLRTDARFAKKNASDCRASTLEAFTRLERRLTVRGPDYGTSGSDAETSSAFARKSLYEAGFQTRSAVTSIVFVEQFYYPEGWGGAELARDVTVALAKAGFDVEVICGSDQYSVVEGDPGPDPRSFGVRINRISSLLAGRIHHRKLLRQIWFYVSLIPRLAIRARPRLFISQTNPPLGVVLTALAARIWRRPLIIIAMDVYPEVLVAHGLIGARSLLGRLLRAVFDWSYRSAERIVSLGPVMTRRLQAKTSKASTIVEISNWATGPLTLAPRENNPLRASLALTDGLTIVYSGNLGIGHEFDTLLEGFTAALRTDDALILVIIGVGKRLDEVRNTVARLGIDHAVRFVEFLPAERLPESMGLADVAVVTLREGFEGLIVPSKLLGYMARGLPVLYIGPPSDVEYYLQKSGGGVSIRNGDVAAVASALLKMNRNRAFTAGLGTEGRMAYERELARDHGLSRYVAMVRAVASERR